ncbi:MAG TPA: hypothetical protein GXZ88_04680 [Firmicutes bacterium]|nr:hypothetical protein [Candidatus Fermentithermobacillaceae bacterium]
MQISTNIWQWISVICIFGMWSLPLYKDNPFYRVCQNVFVGSCAGHAIGIAIGNIVNYGFEPLFTQSKIDLLIPVILGLMLYTRFFPGVAWLSRWPVAFLVGVGVGQTIYASLRSQVINQSIAAMTKFPQPTVGATINGLVSLIGLLSILTYFLFTVPQSGVVRGMSELGRWMMMVTFGVGFGNVVSGRLSVLLGELLKIFGDWLGMI